MANAPLTVVLAMVRVSGQEAVCCCLISKALPYSAIPRSSPTPPTLQRQRVRSVAIKACTCLYTLLVPRTHSFPLPPREPRNATYCQHAISTYLITVSPALTMPCYGEAMRSYICISHRAGDLLTTCQGHVPARSYPERQVSALIFRTQ